MFNITEHSGNNNNNNIIINFNDLLLKCNALEEHEEIIFHMKIKLSYYNDNNNNKDINFNIEYYLFIFPDKIIITKTLFNENNNFNPILLKIFYLQFISINLISKETTENELNIEFHSLNFQNNNEIHMKFLSISDGYFINHFIKKITLSNFKKYLNLRFF